MNQLAEFWNLIVQSNTFNFAILLLIFAIVLKKMNITAMIEKMKDSIIVMIENADKERENAITELETAKKAVENLENEINEQIHRAEIHAKAAAKQILDEASQKVKRIENSVSRAIEAEEKTLSAKLSDKALLAASAVAKEHIIRTLNENPDLHNKYINDSIEELEGIKF